MVIKNLSGALPLYSTTSVPIINWPLSGKFAVFVTNRTVSPGSNCIVIRAEIWLSASGVMRVWPAPTKDSVK